MKNRSFIAAAVVPTVMLVMLLSVIPIFYNVYLSTTDMSLFHYHDYRFVGAANYLTLFTSPVSDFTRLLVWNVVYSLSCILIPFVIGVAAARMLFGSLICPMTSWSDSDRPPQICSGCQIAHSGCSG